jgi:hypothetical protein
MHDQDLFTDMWGIGPEQSPAFGLKLLGQAVVFVGLVALGVYIWNPEKRSVRVGLLYWTLLTFLNRCRKNSHSMPSELNLAATLKIKQMIIFLSILTRFSQINTFQKHFSNKLISFCESANAPWSSFQS